MLFSGDDFGQNPVITCSLAALVGVCVGSFLNVVALRSLREESFLWPASHCMSCDKPLALYDNVPLLSYLILGGKCRHCRAPISIQYPLVEFLTGVTFAAVAFCFLVLKIPYAAGNGDLLTCIAVGMRMVQNTGLDEMPAMLKLGLAGQMFIFASTLIAVTVTDLREKLIPHEITYPSMIVGIGCAAVFRQDLLGTMAGIGASYIVFDFLAFYGLKLYMRMHPGQEEERKLLLSSLQSKYINHATKLTRSRPKKLLSIPAEKVISRKSPESKSDNEPIEVMGGGDAVLSAVMSAYLGWQLLVVSLVIGFAAGTLGGLVLLVAEMKKAGLMKDCLKMTGIFALFCGLAFALLVGFTTAFLQIQSGSEVEWTSWDYLKPILLMAAAGAAGGALLGVVKVGTRVSKPFPFGPALALGGFVAMFMVPFWLPYAF